jgi:hypothetical protein
MISFSPFTVINNFSDFDLPVSAKIKYIFLARCGILLRKNRRGGYHHENSFGFRSYLQRWSPYPGYPQWPDDLSPGSSSPEKDPYGYPGRTLSANGRGDLPAFSLQNQKIILRHPPFRPGKQDRETPPSEEWSQDTTQENPRAGKKGNPTAPYHGEGYVCHYSSPKCGRLLCEIQTGSPNLGQLWYKQKKITSQVAKERSLHLLTPESVEVLDSSLKPKKVEISRHSVHSDLQELLRKGFTTSCAGGFFFIPYLQELDIHLLLGKLYPPKREGIPPDRIALQLIFEALFGYTRGIRTVDPISQADFGAISGLPFLCSPSAEYRFLTGIPMENSERFQIALGNHLLELGHIGDRIVNMDAHSILLYSRKEMKASYISQDKVYGKAIRAFYTQDQERGKPLFVRACYSGTSAGQATPALVEATQAILGGTFLSVTDKEWYVALLLEQLDKIYKIEVLLPLKRTAKRLQEMESIDFQSFKAKAGDSPLATLFTALDGFTGRLRLFVKRNPVGTLFGLITNKKYLRARSAMKIYSHRWRIENWFNENSFLGLNCLPSLELHAIQAALTFRLVAYHLMDNFRMNLGSKFATMTPALIHRHFIQGVQGKVQLQREQIHIDIYGFRHQAKVRNIFTNLENKLIAKGIDPRVPWLNGYKLHFEFK